MNISEKEKEFCEIIKYEFKDMQLLNNALTHSTYVNENRLKYNLSNERLEFLGDAILDFIVSEYLYKNLQEEEEGVLTRKRANIVCEPSLVNCGKKIRIGEFLILGKGEENNGGRNRPSMIADAVEALIGAIYLDSNFETVKEVVLRNFINTIEKDMKENRNVDYKTQIQEMFQAEGETKILYEIYKEGGPDHNKTFYVDIIINGKKMGRGVGRSKKVAEQDAARMAIKKKRGELY